MSSQNMSYHLFAPSIGMNSISFKPDKRLVGFPDLLTPISCHIEEPGVQLIC